MKNKKLISLFLVLLLLLSVCPINGFAAAEKPDIGAFTFPTPAAPRYFMFDAADRTATEGHDALYLVRMADMSVLELSAEFDSDSDAFREKYGLYDFTLVMQFDTSLDGTDNWNYTPEWDTSYYAPGSSSEAAGIFWVGSELMEQQNIFDLYECWGGSDNYSKLKNAIIEGDASDGFENYYFDYENHSLSVRVRYYMEWQTWDGETVDDIQSKFSEWSEVGVFGKGGNAITPAEPTAYEAPVISDLQFLVPTEGDYSEVCTLTYFQETPKQVWDAGVYYIMTENGYFDGLETQISINGREWQEYHTPNSWGDWCLWNGARTAYVEEPALALDQYVQLRVRFTGSAGVSPWSNVLAVNAPTSKLGDVNYDGQVTAADALLVLQKATDKIFFSEKQMELGDVNGDTAVTANDALLVLQYATQKITSFPAER